MATGFPVKANYATGDVLTAANMNDLAGTLNYLDPTAKGDLFPASDGSTLTRLAVGTNGQVLTADSTQTTGMKWATPSAVSGWVSYTPTFTNLTVGNGTLTGAYRQNGNVVDCYMKILWGSTTSVSGNVSFTLPVTADGTETNAIKQGGVLYKSGAYFWWGSAYMANTTTARIFSADLASSTNGIAQRDISATVPSTWAANDSFQLTFSYRV